MYVTEVAAQARGKVHSKVYSRSADRGHQLLQYYERQDLKNTKRISTPRKGNEKKLRVAVRS